MNHLTAKPTQYPNTIAPRNPRAGELENPPKPIESAPNPQFQTASPPPELNANASIAAGAIADLPAIELAMNIASIGIISPKACPPTKFSDAIQSPNQLSLGTIPEVEGS